MKKRGFSLIELLVVVSILGVLASVAVPAYSAYSTRSKISMVSNVMRAWQDSLLSDYHRTGSFPVTSSLGGTTVSIGGTPSTVSISPYITDASYLPICNGSGGGCSTGRIIGVWTQFSINSSNTGVSAYLRAYVKVDGNSIQFYCGNAHSSGSNIPAQFLPSGCVCWNMATIFSTGTVTSYSGGGINSPC